jgi:hypothetical protein
MSAYLADCAKEVGERARMMSTLGTGVVPLTEEEKQTERQRRLDRTSAADDLEQDCYDVAGLSELADADQAVSCI